MATEARYIPTAEVAKMVRQTLRSTFPGVKFSVRQERLGPYMSSICVTWKGEPHPNEVHGVVDWMHGGSFDGMTDSTVWHDSTLNGELVRFGNYSISASQIEDGGA